VERPRYLYFTSVAMGGLRGIVEARRESPVGERSVRSRLGPGAPARLYLI